MNRKEYELIAATLKANHEDGGEITIIYWLADAFEKEYTNFNRDKFLTACGVTETNKE